jgi:uncharacterized protein YbbC (DUF1343 family)/CubicO group peptidase (beta-lactamase class C family)
MRRTCLYLFVFLFISVPTQAQQRYAGAADITRAIQDSIDAGEIPGAVVQVGRGPAVLMRRAIGSRALEPRKEPMTVDTVFDAASLTKVVATTSCIMKLWEQGRIRLNDPVTRYLPEFQAGSSAITVRHLLTHFSGLRPDVDLVPAWTGHETGIQKALIDKPVAAPGETFIYSDINFILLGEIVHRLSGKPLDVYAREILFRPLGMRDTMFKPPAALRPRIAPTERDLDGRPLRGTVHDETTRFMGGVAGHAGMFTTAADLSRFAQMILNGGALGKTRLFQPATIRKFTEPQTPPDQPVLRGLGWDIDSRFSGNRGELFPIGSHGHTGFTGTSLWLDPASRTYVILLANSVHPVRKPAITSLRARVATIAAVHAGIKLAAARLTGYNETMAGARRSVARNGYTLTGLDVLARDSFARLKGKRVGVITNHTGLDREGRRNVDLMLAAGVKVAALYAPEHGIQGTRDDDGIGHATDERTGLPIFSLYQGEKREPTGEMLSGIDLLIFDIQDVGARFYTYMCTMLNAMREAGRAGLPVMILDRPNPITGVHVEGPMLDDDLRSFIGCHSLPLRHGMTLGEIAAMVNDEDRLGVKLEVVKMEGWQRGDWFDSTGLVWVNPSPNMRSLNAALLYPGVAMLESSRNYSVGRGTDSPFEQVGAEWIRGPELANYLNSRHIPGVRVYATRFSPASSNLAGKPVEGIRLVVIDRDRFSSTRFGIELAGALTKLYPGKLSIETNLRLIGNRAVAAALTEGTDPRLVAEAGHESLSEFLRRRDKYLLYR